MTDQENTVDVINYELAERSTRLFALIIDSALLGAITGMFGASDLWLIGGLVTFAIGAGYHVLFLTRNNGQTPGKMIMGIRVIKTDGSEIEPFDAVIRYVGYAINSAVFMLGWLWAFVDDNAQGFHDKLARTYVVKAQE